MSSWVPVSSGVPQGSVIGPILFLVYINDLPAKLQSKVRIFADETILYMAVNNETDAAILQKDLKLLEEWENRSEMYFHPDKSNVLRVTHDYILHNQILKEKDAVKYLGVTVHHKLSWNEHICSMVKEANSSIGFLRRNLQIHQKHINANAKRVLFDHKSSMRLLYGILSPKRTKITLRWYKEELPALLVTTTDAKQMSLLCLMSLAGAVSSSEEQTKNKLCYTKL